MCNWAELGRIYIKYHTNYTGIQHLFTGENITQSALKAGLFIAIVFPIIILLSTHALKNKISIADSSLR